MLKWILAISLVLLIHCHVFAQENTDDKLRLHPVNIDKLDMVTLINSVSQDSRGYLWVSGISGVLRFDGYQSVFYPYPQARKVVEDAQGRRWLLTGNGLYLYCSKEDKFNSYLDELHHGKDGHQMLFRDSFSAVRNINSHTFRPVALHQDQQGFFWLAGDDGRIVRFSADDDRFRLYDFPSSRVKHNLRFGITFYRDTPLFVSTEGEVYSLDKVSGAFVKIWQSTELAGARIVISGEANTMYVVSEHGFYLLDLSETSRQPLKQFEFVDHRAIKSVHRGLHATYIMTDSELFALGANNKIDSVNSYYADGRMRQMFLANSVFDEQGAVWLSSNRGIFEVEQPLPQLSNGNVKSLTKTTTMPMVKSVLVDNQENLWFISQHTVYFRAANAARGQPVSIDPELPDRKFYSVFSDKDNMLWFSSASSLYRYNRQQKTTQKIQVPLEVAVMGSQITDIEQTSNGHLWLLTYRGVAEYDPEHNQILSFQPGHFKNLKKGPNDTVLACGFDTYLLGQFSARKIQFQIEKTNKRFVVYDASIENDGQLWAATSYGLLLHSLTTGQTQQIDLNGVYPDLAFFFAYQDRAGYIWLMDMSNLYKVSLQTRQVTFSIPQKRLNIGIKTYGSIAESSTGTLYIGGVNGFAELENTSAIAPYGVHINRVIVQGDSYPVYLDEESAEYTISPGTQFDSTQRNIKFEFVNIKRDPDIDVYYRYQLVGFDNEWSEVDQTERSATYTNLPPGQYEFVIRSRAISSGWTQARFKFEIATPYYLTGWAFAFYVVCLVILIALSHVLRTHQLKRQNQRLEKLVVTRTQEIEQKRAQIATLMESKNQLFGNISHELRTPLSVIMLPIKSMLKQNSNSDNRTWQAAFSQAQRLEKLIDNLIRYARKDDLSTVENHHFTAKNVLIKQIRAFELLAHEKQIQVTVNDSLANQEVLLNEADFEQVVTNLLSNAVKYTPVGGVIAISAHQCSNILKITVTNSGPGISAALQSEVFKRYVRGEHKEISGEGIGLSVVHQLVTKCSGKITLESEPHKGCCFTLHIPIFHSVEMDKTEAEESVSKPQSHTPSEQKQTRKPGYSLPRILIAEDNPELRMVLRESLSTWFDCMVATDGELGLALVRSELPDLILSDVMMPNMTGLEMLREVKQDESTSHIPVILLTAKEDDASRILGFEAEADDYMGKPFDIDVLRYRIENLIKGRKKLARVFQHQILHNEQITGATTDEKRTPFIDKIHQAIAQNYQDPEFDTERMAGHVFLSTRQLQRKARSLTGLSPNALLRKYRLQQACLKLRTGVLVTDVAYQVGFSSPAYFSSCFKSEFNLSPQQYVKQQSTEIEQETDRSV
ncbi:hybrid sensor histidine kinase/response regulator transcription factor [Pseudoalteromonas rubra]|uniref:histidine kinase n=1 Tax=Pseudoalteromonas rubra TaxID=43658 RepID=A0A5S3X5K4_9GAMM|nr:ATP-binding protein [Pseudoalteromonas rubra]TMP39559.1 hypothetical protein CWB98_02935 [Pseudoalteromonas rubra]